MKNSKKFGVEVIRRDSMKKISLISVFVLLGLLTGCVSALDVKPDSIELSLNVSEQAQEYLNVSNLNTNTTAQLYFGTNSSNVVLGTTSLLLDANMTQEVLVLINAPSSEGTYCYKITVSGDLTKEIPVVVTIKKWLYTIDDWFMEGQDVFITFSGKTYKIHIEDIDEPLLYLNDELVGNIPYSDDNINITVKQKMSTYGLARLIIQTTSADTSITTQEFQQLPPGVNIKLEPIVNKIIMTIQTETETQKLLSIKNIGNVPVKLQDMFLENVIETPSGTKPIAIPDVSLGTIDPGEDLSFTVKIDSKGLKEGTYTPSLYIVGYYNNTRIQTEIDFQITVISTLAPQETVNVGINAPETVDENEEFTIVVTGVPSDASLFIPPTPNVEGSWNYSDSTWTWKGKITKGGTYTIQIWLMKQVGGSFLPVDSLYATITVRVPEKEKEQSKIVIYPEKPLDGDTVSVKCVDADGDKIQNAEITVNGEPYEEPFMVEGDKTYKIECDAVNYKSSSMDLVIGNRILQLTLVPEKPKINDFIYLIARDVDTSEIIVDTQNRIYKNNAKVLLNGEPFTNVITEAGSFTIEVTADKYETATLNFDILPPLEMISPEPPESVSTGQNVSIEYNIPVEYKVIYKETPESEEVIYLQGEGSSIKFTPEYGGTYDIYVNDEKVKSVNVIGSILDLNIDWNFVLIVLIMVVVAIYLFKRGKRPKKEVSGELRAIYNLDEKLSKIEEKIGKGGKGEQS